MKHADLVAFLKAARLTADDNTALTGMELYPVWAVGNALFLFMQEYLVRKRVS